MPIKLSFDMPYPSEFREIVLNSCHNLSQESKRTRQVRSDTVNDSEWTDE